MVLADQGSISTDMSVETLNKSNLPKFTLAEVNKHQSREDCWTTIEGKVYDISSFMNRHPGGELIMQCAGRESSVLFLTSHPMSVKKTVLPKYLIGDLVKPEGSFDYSYHSVFYDTVRSRVEQHFSTAQLAHRDLLEVWATAIFTIFMFATCYYLAYLQGIWFFAIPCGWFMSQLGINIMHDANHGAFSKSPRVNQAMGLVMDVLGGSSFIWKHQHNIGHHQWTNSTVEDPDCTTGYPFIRFNQRERWLFFHRFQHLYIWALYGVHSYKWYFMDMWNFAIGHYRSVAMYQPSNFEVASFIVCKSIVFCLHFLIPILILGPIHWFLTFVCVVTTTSYCFSFQFVINHLVEESTFPEFNNAEHDWAKLQIMTSANYSNGGWFWSYISGGLNYQIEHHLFPTYSHTLYRNHIAPIVKQACSEFNVPYNAQASWWNAIKSHYNHLYNMGTQPVRS